MRRVRGRELQRRRALALNMYGTRCYLCGEHVLLDVHWTHPLAYQLEHRTPLIAGGTDTPDNWAIAHRRCNLKKGTKTIGNTYRSSRQW